MRNPTSLLARCLAFAAALTLAPDCQRAEESASAPENTAEAISSGGSGIVISAAIWKLTWDEEGVTPLETGGFEVETDIGYHVRIGEARILSHSVSLGLCDPAVSESAAAQPFFGLSVRSARAHTGNTDPSTIETSLIEDLTHPETTETANSFAPGRYCRAHWLLARPTNETAGPDDVSMQNRSLILTGTFARGGTAHQLRVETWWPEGLLLDLETVVSPEKYAAAQEDGKSRHAFVTVTRHLARMFDGIDFEAASEDQIKGLLIDNLVSTTDIAVDLWAPGTSG